MRGTSSASSSTVSKPPLPILNRSTLSPLTNAPPCALPDFSYEDFGRGRLDTFRSGNGLSRIPAKRRGPGMLKIGHPGFCDGIVALQGIQRAYGVRNVGPHQPGHPLPRDMRAASAAHVDPKKGKYWLEVGAPGAPVADAPAQPSAADEEPEDEEEPEEEPKKPKEPQEPEEERAFEEESVATPLLPSPDAWSLFGC